MWDFLHQPDGTERETVAEMLMFASAKNKFGAAAANIHEQKRCLRQERIGRYALKCQFRFAVAGNDFDFQTGRLLDGGGQMARVDGVTRGASGDDTNRSRLVFPGFVSEPGNRFGGACSGSGLQSVRLVKALSKPGLPTRLEHGPDIVPGDIGYQDFYRVGANINDGAANGLHRPKARPSAQRGPRKIGGLSVCDKMQIQDWTWAFGILAAPFAAFQSPAERLP